MNCIDFFVVLVWLILQPRIHIDCFTISLVREKCIKCFFYGIDLSYWIQYIGCFMTDKIKILFFFITLNMYHPRLCWTISITCEYEYGDQTISFYGLKFYPITEKFDFYFFFLAFNRLLYLRNGNRIEMRQHKYYAS